MARLTSATSFSLMVLLVLKVIHDGDSIKARIYGGSSAAHGEFPYTVAMLHYGVQYCTGSIIDEHRVLTAAHCVKDHPVSEVSVLAGCTDLCTNGNQPGEIVSRAIAFYIPQKYIREMNLTHGIHYINNDIAVVELEDPLTMGPTIQPINLGTYKPRPGDLCTLTGFGYTLDEPNIEGDGNGTHKLPCVLRKAVLPVTNHRCVIFDSSTQFCAGYDQQQPYDRPSDANSCLGDSGGPLVYSGAVVGVMSYGFECDPSAGRPSSFHFVSNYIGWILDVMAGHVTPTA